MAVKSPTRTGIAQEFATHILPVGALPVRCHVLDPTRAKAVEDFLVDRLPWCYTTKKHLQERFAKTGLAASVALANTLPDPGSVMSGDFGEITTMFFLASERRELTHLIRKWRYKEDRNRAALHSDVIILYREDEKDATERDFVICAEAKQKATASKFDPISKAIEGFELDRTGRLGRTLTWLREKAIDHENAERIRFIERFAFGLTTEYMKYFKAVAIVDRSLLDGELTRQIELPQQDESFEVVVLGITDLKDFYERVFKRATTEVTI